MVLRICLVGLLSVLIAAVLPPAVAAEVEDHPVIKPMPGSQQAGKPAHRNYEEIEVRADGKTKSTIGGEWWYLPYEILDAEGLKDTNVSATEILRNYQSAATRAGGSVHWKTQAYTTISIPRKSGGKIWCTVWAGSGQYTLTIVEEEALQPTLTLGAEEMRDQIQKSGTVPIYGVLFNTDKATLQTGSGCTLDEMARLFQLMPGLQVEVQGHTDATGSKEHNKALSMQRARSVVDALVLYGVPASQLVARGVGDEQPVADNATDEGRRLNRRVQLQRIE